jgi:hypothetical protein
MRKFIILATKANMLMGNSRIVRIPISLLTSKGSIGIELHTTYARHDSDVRLPSHSTWLIIAGAQVSESSRSLFGKRSAQECKVQWVGADHPSLKNPADWDGGEDEQLKALVGGRNVKDGEVDWGQLSTHFNVHPKWAISCA